MKITNKKGTRQRHFETPDRDRLRRPEGYTRHIKGTKLIQSLLVKGKGIGTT